MAFIVYMNFCFAVEFVDHISVNIMFHTCFKFIISCELLILRKYEEKLMENQIQPQPNFFSFFAEFMILFFRKFLFLTSASDYIILNPSKIKKIQRLTLEI